MLRSSSGKRAQGRDCLGWPQRAKTRPLILAQAATGAPAIAHKRIQQDLASAAKRQEPVLRMALCGIARAGAAPHRRATDSTVRCANLAAARCNCDCWRQVLVAPTAEIQRGTQCDFVDTVRTTALLLSARHRLHSQMLFISAPSAREQISRERLALARPQLKPALAIITHSRRIISQSGEAIAIDGVRLISPPCLGKDGNPDRSSNHSAICASPTRLVLLLQAVACPLLASVVWPVMPRKRNMTGL
jgi:hypothetical protein